MPQALRDQKTQIQMVGEEDEKGTGKATNL